MLIPLSNLFDNPTVCVTPAYCEFPVKLGGAALRFQFYLEGAGESQFEIAKERYEQRGSAQKDVRMHTVDGHVVYSHKIANEHDFIWTEHGRYFRIHAEDADPDAIFPLCSAVPFDLDTFASPPPGAVHTFRDETVLDVYSLDYAARSYHRLTGEGDIARILPLLEEASAAAPEKTETGFLVVTDKGRYPFYLPAGGGALPELARAFNGKYPPRVQWLCFMDPAVIASVSYEGVRTTDRESVRTIADALKDLTLSSGIKILTGAERIKNPSGERVEIRFAGGVVYSLAHDGGILTISSSDMPEQLVYRLPGGDPFRKLRNLINQESR